VTEGSTRSDGAAGGLEVWLDAMALAVLVTPSFARAAKKLHTKDKAVLDAAIKVVASAPSRGAEKRGDQVGFFVHTFKRNNREIDLASGESPCDRGHPPCPIPACSLNWASNKTDTQGTGNP